MKYLSPIFIFGVLLSYQVHAYEIKTHAHIVTEAIYESNLVKPQEGSTAVNETGLIPVLRFPQVQLGEGLWGGDVSILLDVELKGSE